MIKFLTDSQLHAEFDRCEYCEEKPCQQGCPVHCSPMDFIKAARLSNSSDFKRSTAEIMSQNPLGGVCGAVCPDTFCMRLCVHKNFDRALNIPDLQATIVQKAKDLGVMPEFNNATLNGKKIAIIGAGPAGLAASAVLAQQGYLVEIFEKENQAGGMCRLIPDHRLDKSVLDTDIEFLLSLGHIEIHYEEKINDPILLFAKGFDAVIVAIGLDNPLRSDIPGKELAYDWIEYLTNAKTIDVQQFGHKRPRLFPRLISPAQETRADGAERGALHRSPLDSPSPLTPLQAAEISFFKNKNIAIIGGGAIGLDVAVTAKHLGAHIVDIIYRRDLKQMKLTEKERNELLHEGIGLVPRTVVTEILGKKSQITGLKIVKVDIPEEQGFKPEHIIPNSETILHDYDHVIFAIGTRSHFQKISHEKLLYAGDYSLGAATVVQAAASGKNAASKVDALLSGKTIPAFEEEHKSVVKLDGHVKYPVPLETDFFGRKIRSPFILSAAPPTDGYDQMKKAYDAGWAGGVMKTTFDNVPIHIPGEYMFAFSKDTYANCDNVSGHPLDRVCAEIKKLVKEYPDRLTIGSTGGHVTGHDESDKLSWQSNTKKLEKAGAMAIEYSLSCPQGGDGMEGNIVSQNPALSAKIIGWVMEVSDPNIPKLFKLTPAVTSIYPVINAIKKVFAKYPNKKAGITLANSFPSLGFRKSKKKNWEEGVVVGLSGEGIAPISNLTLANVSGMDVTVSGNGGPMNYKEAADFLALGAKTVQFCTVAMKDGIEVIGELESGLSYMMQSRRMKSMKDLIGCALPNPITDFMELSAQKKISSVDAELCEHCGNCTRCPYLAITLDQHKIPQIDPSRCVGCSICSKKCFAEALSMRQRTESEEAAVSE